MKKCKHKNIIITTKDRYYIPNGWNWWEEQDKLELIDFLIESEGTEAFCEDCGEFLYS